jgi:hypothetical protein
VNNLHSYIFLNSTNNALDILNKWYEKKPNNKELQDLIKSFQYIVEHTNMVELERQLYKDHFDLLSEEHIKLKNELKELWDAKG